MARYSSWQEKATVAIERAVAEAYADGKRDGRREAKFPSADEKHIETLCRAIAFQHQVELGYNGDLRTVEPTLIRQTASGRLLLYATRLFDDGTAPEVRSYRVDRIESAHFTGEPFTAKEG